MTFLRKKTVKIILLSLAAAILLAAITAGIIFAVRAVHKKAFNAIQFHAETEAELTSLFEAGKPTILFFGADYCPECRAYYDAIGHLALAYGDEITIRYINTEEHTPVRKVYNVERIPSTVFFDKEGKPWIPDSDLTMRKEAYIVPKRAHISEVYTPTLGADLGENPSFEFGITADGGTAYCKYQGIITYWKLRNIANMLLK